MIMSTTGRKPRTDFLVAFL